VTGGRNGYGAKLANIFSKEFVIETCDGQRQRCYRQVFRANMTQKDAPAIRACKASENWTCVTFCPDLAKFGAAGRTCPHAQRRPGIFLALFQPACHWQAAHPACPTLKVQSGLVYEAQR
jgi:hypothetical protein